MDHKLPTREELIEMAKQHHDLRREMQQAMEEMFQRAKIVDGKLKELEDLHRRLFGS